jgi:dynein heavy chain
MRAVKSVLVMAGKLRREDSGGAENIVLIRAMRDSNVPKFLEHDLPLFDGIVDDLFPGVVVPFIDYGKLQVAIENQLRLAKFQVPPKYVKKVI